jgi:patatin-related protein
MSIVREVADRPAVEFDQEVRFAVVLYGGSSLAIYINGVAQELLRLVRATAPDATGERTHLPDSKLRASERVYRRLGRVLSRQTVQSAQVATDDRNPQNDSTIRTRFVVDILTGTSAGGINAVYLAKALANDQDIDELKKLWVTEGDIGVLINDNASYETLKFGITKTNGEPWSVLNSRRMYLKLLEALRDMDQKKAACEKGKSPLVDELDLFVTATDMQGRVLQLRLADKVVSEYRHRNVFRFRYRSERASGITQSDFGREFNAFLAFVARATSAHQAAFSPINLNDVTPIIKSYAMEGEYSAADKALRAFYQDYLLELPTSENASEKPRDIEMLAEDFRKVWFVDGGTLDNKPFSFVVGELPLRNADNFVDRKLLYVEPSPEHLTRSNALKKRPRIVKNALAALSSLPRYETIVEDLTRLLERNRTIERLDRIMRGMEADLSRLKKEPRNREQFLQMLQDPNELNSWMQQQGPSWGGYMRLRVAEVTDDLALLVTRAAGFDEESDEFLAIRYLVRDWRERHYDAYMRDGKRSQLQFLVEFDLLWALRRIQFVIKKLNDLACLSESDVDARRIAGVPRREEISSVYPREDELAEFRKATQRLRTELNKISVRLRRKRRRFWAGDGTNPFVEYIQRFKLTSKDLLLLLREPTDKARNKTARNIMNKIIIPEDAKEQRHRIDALQDLADEVKKELGRIVIVARNKLSKTLRPKAEAKAQLSSWELFLRETLWYYYISFEDFDQIAYPLLYSTGVGAETDVIDVFRVSPEDATALIDQNRRLDKRGHVANGEDGTCVRKLAGTVFGNFGAFFEEKFRVNDIMWGRLDAAERIIATVLPQHDHERGKMTGQAHRAILVEEKLFADEKAACKEELQAVVWDALDVWDNKEHRLALLKQAAKQLTDPSPFREYLNILATDKDPCDLFREDFMKNYKEDRQFTTAASLKSAVRINRVLNNMAGGYLPAADRSWTQRILIIFGRFVRVFVEAAIKPDGGARRAQLLGLAFAYVFSLAILVLVCVPGFYLLRSGHRQWLSWLAIVLTVPLAFIPLALTFSYSLLWRKLRRAMIGRLARLVNETPDCLPQKG